MDFDILLVTDNNNKIYTNLLLSKFKNEILTFDTIFQLSDIEKKLINNNYKVIVFNSSIILNKLHESNNFIFKYKLSQFKSIILHDDNVIDVNLELNSLKISNDFIYTDCYNEEKLEIIYLRIKNLIKNNESIEDTYFKINTLKEEIICLKDESIEIKIIGKPYDLFVYFFQNQNRMILKEELLDKIWCKDFSHNQEDISLNVLEVAISKIRNRIDKVFNITTIETIRGKGYKMNITNNNS